MTDLEVFRREAREWLTANCPASLVGRESTPFDGVWGGTTYAERRAMRAQHGIKAVSGAIPSAPAALSGAGS